MRKLFAVLLLIAAVVGGYLLLVKPIEDESQSQHQQQRQQHQKKQHKQALKPPPESWMVPFPHIQGQTLNLEAFWVNRKNERFTEVWAWHTRYSSVLEPKAIRFETDSKGIHLHIDPKAEMLRAEVIYSNGDRSDLYEHVEPWNGNGTVAQTMTLTAGEKTYRLKLTEIVVLAHDPRYYSDDKTGTNTKTA